MPVEIMGDSEKMAAFRTRQAQSPEAVPTDIERQNELSKHRNRYTHLDDDRSGETAVPDPVRRVLSTPGQSLDAAVQSDLAERLGDRFDDVTIHTGPEAAKACESIDARAFTVGSHVVFNYGEFDPDSATGKYLLAHELVHTRQQTDGQVTRLPAAKELEVRDSSSAYEREADELASEALRSDAGVGALTPSQAALSVQRMHKHELLEVLDDELEEDLPEEFEDGLPEEVLEKLPEALRDGYENGHPAFTRAYEREFDNATFQDLTKSSFRNSERWGEEGEVHWTWEEVANSILYNSREGIENLSEREQRTLALFMNESDEIAAEFGKTIERHWQGLSGGDYLNETAENSTAGAVVDLSLGQPFIATTVGAITAPVKAQLEYQVDKRLPKDYEEYNKLELVRDALKEAKESERDLTKERDEEKVPKTERTQFENAKYGDQIQTDHGIESSTGGQSTGPEQIEENLRDLRAIQSEEWVNLSQDKREKYIKTLQEEGLMSRVLVGTMASVDPENIDRPDPVEYAKEGVSSAGVSGTAGTVQKAGTNTVDSGSTDPIEALSIGAAKGSTKGFATILTKIAADRLGTEEKIKETGDRIEEDILKSVKGIRSQPEQTQDSKEAYDELVVELIKILDEEERFENYD
ncbi:hypothetical protein C500_18468 [Natrialba magadii ATCC 43099]|nr:DUF4157 domain-containing protein [Natrialba magadii]ELY24940.1 hypothetical protein C500_18468 [Natrialba magadii ATCC 43099]